MSLHRSLKTKPSALNQHRNVLKRSERIERMEALGKFDPSKQPPIGLPKTANRRMKAGKKTAKAE